MNENNKQTKIYTLYTGGTIGMHTNNKPLTPASLDNFLTCLPEEYQTKNRQSFIKSSKSNVLINWDSTDKIIDSSECGPDSWQEITRKIINNYHSHDGTIVLHGTDTMAYTASATSFALGRINKPIVFTGSQIPLTHADSDAARNLYNSIQLIAKHSTNEVCIVFGDHILRANRTTKVNTTAFNAFYSPNYPGLGSIDKKIQISPQHLLPEQQPEFPREANISFSDKIKLLAFHPGVDISNYCSQLNNQKNQGFILRVYGSGNLPRSSELETAISTAIQNNRPVICSSQCLYGSIVMETYESGNWLHQCGVINGGNMTLEAIITKLMWGLKQIPANKITNWMLDNIAGERNG